MMNGREGGYYHDQMGVFLEGTQVDTVSTARREVVTNTYQVTVADGQFNLWLDDLGGRAFRCVANCVQLDTFWVVGCKGASALHHLF